MLRSIGMRVLYPDDGGGAGGMGGGSGDGGTGGTGGAAGGTNDGGQGAGGEYVGPAWAKDWNVQEKELLSDPSLKAIQDPASLLKSYVHAQKNMGAQKTVIPGANATREEHDQFWMKVGWQAEEGKYSEAMKYNKEKSAFDETAHKEFVKQAHALRVPPDQANKLYETFSTQAKTIAQRSAEAAAAQKQDGLNALQEKLGIDAYNVRLTKATNFVKENAPEFYEYLGKSGLGKDAGLVSALMTFAEKFSGEEKLPAGDAGLAQTIDDIEKEINEMIADKQGAYLNSKHPDHGRQVNRMLALQTSLEKNRGRA